MIRARVIGFNACDVRIVNAALSEKLPDDPISRTVARPSYLHAHRPHLESRPHGALRG